MIITIDGPSGTGKSTVAQEVARRLSYTFFDTGAMYRSVAWFIVERGIDPAEEKKVAEVLPECRLQIETLEGGGRRYQVGETDVTQQIRQPHISAIASQIASYGAVRKKLVILQREFGQKGDVVFEGRDMGTVVFPDADLKIFLTASATIRAERRHHELLGKFPDLARTTTLGEILRDIEQRDRNDATRVLSPLRQAHDAHRIDTSHLSLDEVVQLILKLQGKKTKRFPPMKFSYWGVYWIARLFFILFFRLEVRGLAHFKPGAGVLVANHTSFYDPPLFSIACPEEVHFLARDPLFRVPLLGRLIARLNAHPVTRGVSDVATFRMMLRLLEEGKKLIIFPEGSRSTDGILQPLERGFAFLVTKGKVPVYPAYLEGTFAAWPPHKKWPKLWGKMRCTFAPPIHWEQFADLPHKEGEQALLAATRNALEELALRPR